jgi:serine/threonine protein kinase/Tol biopolymer transport system component
VALNPGTRIGGYEIVGTLGAGGMGEVYRARDLRLQRDVAFKVLPPLFISDPERLARFEREARLLASLNHPHIAAIYGVEESAAAGRRMPVLVLELVDGETIEDRLARGPIPLGEATSIAVQVAEALEAAHDRGIVHRDLKPANIKIARDGKVKVLDFGLAKALDQDGASSASDPMLSPTLTSGPATAMGLVMGTAAYMAPEQARGKAVDRRADIWAFGAVLYEMLAGVRPFPGETVSDTLAAVLTAAPDWSRLPADTPRSVRTLLARCLEKDPRQRLQAIGEARIALTAPAAQVERIATRPSRRLMAAVAAGALIVGAFAGAAAMLLRNETPARSGSSRKFDLMLDGLQINIDSAPSISPNGDRMLYRASGRLFVRALSEFAPKPLPGTDGATYFFWSPDGRQVAFVRDSKIWRIGVDSGEPTQLGAVPRDLQGTGGGVWTASGDLVIAGSDGVGLFAVPLSGAGGREILPLDRTQETDFHDVSELPGGRGLLITVHRLQGPDTIAVLADGKRQNILRIEGESLRSPQYSPAGYLVYSRDTTNPGVWAVRFSLSRLATEGEPFLVAAGGATPSLASDGTLALVRPSDQPAELIAIDRRGSMTPLAVLPGPSAFGPIASTVGWQMVGVSPDRQKLAMMLRGAGGEELFTYDMERRTATRVSQGTGAGANPTWSADGRRIFFASFAGARIWNIYAVSSTEASTPERVLPPSDRQRWPCSVSPDGRLILYAEGMDASTDLWVVPLDGSSAAERVTNTPFREMDGKFSPDGRWIAYTSTESGRLEVYLRPFPTGSGRVQISTTGAVLPAWSPDGREIVYRSGGSLFSVKLAKSGSGLEPSAPQELFSITDPRVLAPFAISADGQRFIFVRSSGNDRVSVVLDWSAHVDQ